MNESELQLEQVERDKHQLWSRIVEVEVMRNKFKMSQLAGKLTF